MSLGCDKRGNIELSQLVITTAGQALIPIGTFCLEHWAEERELRRGRGERTAMHVLREGQTKPCSWVSR